MRKRKVLDNGNSQGRYRCLADPAGSYLLPWADASKLIAEIFAGDPAAEPWHDRPQLLRMTRRPGAKLAARLEAHATCVRTRPLVFLSYAWRDATPLTAAMLRALAARGISIWWDRWSMVRRAVSLH